MHRTLPYSAYSAQTSHDQEQTTLFSTSWHYVGHIGQFNGDVRSIPLEVGCLPIVLTRPAGDELRALVNVCAHRGSLVCTEPSERESLTCPYHAWRYALDGSLLKAPRSEREPRFDKAEHGLEELPVGTWGPFVFVAASHEVISFDELLGDLPDKVKAAGVDVEDLRFHHREQFDLAANWKICAENFLECYHCRVAHPRFAKAIDTSADNYELEVSATYSTQYGPVRDHHSDLIDLHGDVRRAQFHLLYPNIAINIMAGEPNLSIGPMTPTSPATTRRYLDYFFGSRVSDQWIKQMLELDDQVGREDRVLVENMQQGVTARPARHGTLFMDSEHLIDHFENYLRRSVDYER